MVIDNKPEKPKCDNCLEDAKYYSEYMENYYCSHCIGSVQSDYGDNGQDLGLIKLF